MTLSPVERMVDAFVAYVQGSLPTSVTTANTGKTTPAPAFKKIEKSVRVDTQYWPRVIINADGVEIGEAGQLSRMVEAEVDVYAFVNHQSPATLATYLERYIDAIIDLASSEIIIPTTDYGLRVVGADKGVEPDGTRGWVAVHFVVWEEAAY